MRIAMVSHSAYPHDVRIRRECEALAGRGIAVDLVCLRQDGEAPLEQIGNVLAHRMPVRHRRGQGPLGYALEYVTFFLYAFWTLSRLHLRHRYPVVQAHNLPDLIVFAAIVPKLCGARIILDMHDVTPELFQSLYGISGRGPAFAFLCFVERASLAFADRVITVNRNIRDLFVSRNRVAHKIGVVMNSPDPRYFTPTKWASSGGASRSPITDASLAAISPSTSHPPPATASCPPRSLQVLPHAPRSMPHAAFRLFHHGQILRRYSFETAIDAFAIAKSQIPEATLDIYGDGDETYRGELCRYAEARGLNGSVRFHDRVPVERVPALIAEADVGLVPCRRDPFVDKVMLPVRLLEYAVMGLPAVVTRVGTVEAYFSDADVAYCRPGDPADMARQIVALYRDPSHRARLAARAKAAFSDYEWPRQRERYLRLVEGCARHAERGLHHAECLA